MSKTNKKIKMTLIFFNKIKYPYKIEKIKTKTKKIKNKKT
jgi:hypothetical protein